MAQTRIEFTPRGEGSTVQLDFGTHPVLLEFAGFVMPDAEQTVSKGGKALTRIFDSYHLWKVVVERLGPVAGADTFEEVWAWASDAQAGTEFSFALDSDDTADTTFGAEVKGETALNPVGSTTGIEVADFLFLEDATDPTKWQRAEVATVPSGTDLTIARGLRRGFVASSVLRHAEYFPKCQLLDQRKFKFAEREGGKGSNLWDLEFQFRTVR